MTTAKKLTAPPKSDQTPDKPRGKVDVAKAMMLRTNGATYQDIANTMGCTKQAVQERLAKFLADLGDSEEIVGYKELEVKYMDAIRFKYSRHLLDPETVKKASAKDAAIVFGTLYDKQRLERGQSTQNVAVMMASAVIEADRRASEKAKVVTETVTEAEIVGE